MNLNDIEFFCPFTVMEGGNVIYPMFDSPYVPSVELSENRNIDIYIDGYADHPEWEAFSVGYTGQHGYSGAIMHSSEQLSGNLADEIISNPGTYVLTPVESPCTEENPCFENEYQYCVENGCAAAPAGWVVLRMKEVA